MTIKVLLLNFPRIEILKCPSNIEITSCNIGYEPTLHDFHAIILDTEEILKSEYFPETTGPIERSLAIFSLENLSLRIEEQIKTGGVTFCFSSRDIQTIIFGKLFSKYVWCPRDLGIVNEKGDTFYPKFEELKYYSPLLKGFSREEIFWSCYFSKLSMGDRTLATNRAGYSVFVEVPIGSGKLVMLPRFKNRANAVTTLVNEVIPRMILEEEPTFIPEWLPKFSTPLETRTRGLLKEIETAKRLLYTKNKALKKSTAYALEKLGFKVEILPNGTLPDLRIEADELKGIVEVKGHERTQAKRSDLLQLLGYLSETKIQEKGIAVSNHEFQTTPNKRSPKAYTQGAIQLAINNNLSLLSTVDLYEIVLSILEGKRTTKELKEIRTKIMSESGEVKLS